MPPAPGSPSPTSTPPQSHAQALHAPWRLSYLEMLSKDEAAASASPAGAAPPAPGSPAAPKPPCFLREYWLNPAHDERHHVIVRTGRPTPGQPPEPRGGLILLNRYPYANGHLLVSLGESRPRLLDYDTAQRAELWSLVDLAVELCERALACQGVNVGLNQGLAAGAGVPEHAHVHVVPRWHGDINFMTTVGQVRVIPSALDEMAKRYRGVWATIRPST